MTLTIAGADTVLLHDPLEPAHAPHMARLPGDWSLVEVCRVTTDGGIVGYGETIVHYTWGRVHAERLEAVRGRNVFDLMWDDSLGAGLQMAVWDAAGKAAGVPCHRLLGHQVRDHCPISWWCLDMTPEEWMSEGQRALALGYRSLKLKGRPWRDVHGQVEALAEVLPPDVHLDIDFNATLANASVAVPMLQQLEQYPNVAIIETPIPQGDVQGNREIRSKTRLPIAMHFGSPPVMTALREDVCDGFVIGGGARSTLRQATLAAEANKPFWLQLVGTGLTTTWMLHLGAVSTHAQWPAVTCMHIYSDDLLAQPLEVRDGYIRVPDAPGLGVQVDEAALERLRLPEGTPPARKRQLFVVTWPAQDGRPKRQTTYAGYEENLRRDFDLGNEHRFVRGMETELRADDGSAEFDRLYRRAFDCPIREEVK